MGFSFFPYLNHSEYQHLSTDSIASNLLKVDSNFVPAGSQYKASTKVGAFFVSLYLG